MSGRRAFFALAAALLLASPLVVPSKALAQAYPARSVRLVIPYGPTGLPDALARLLAQRLSDALGQQVVVDNKPGASGIIAAEIAAKSAPDGYTLFLTDNNLYGINPAIFPKLPYKPERDFAPVTQAIRGAMFLVVNASLGVNTVQEFVALAKKRGDTNFGSPGNATLHHLGMAQLELLAGLKMTHIPYKGVAQATPALITGDVAVMFAALTSVAPHAKAGKLKILAVGAAQRSPLAPDIPSMTEGGFPAVEAGTSMGIAAPAGTPRPIIDRLNAELVKAIRAPEAEARFTAMGVEPVGNTPEQFAEQIRRDQEHYMRLVRDTGLKVE